MTTKETEESKSKVNWNLVIGAGAVLGGIYLIGKIIATLGGGSPADREQAKLIMIEWQQEYDVMNPYVESIYAGGRTPTEQEIATLSSMVDQMKIKELTIKSLSTSVADQLRDLITTLAANWWLVPVSIASLLLGIIAGYWTIRLVLNWKKRKGPPPNFPCPKCGAVYASEEALKYHIEHEHIATLAYAAEAQQAFRQTSTWVQNAVASESYYAQTFTNWRSWSQSQIKELSWALTSAWVFGLGAASELILLRTALSLLLI